MTYDTKMCSDNSACQYNTYVIHALIKCILPEIVWDTFVTCRAKAVYFKYVCDRLITSSTL